MAADRDEIGACNFLIDCGELLRCGCPEDHEMHDPGHPHGHHPFDPAALDEPPLAGSREASDDR